MMEIEFNKIRSHVIDADTACLRDAWYANKSLFRGFR